MATAANIDPTALEAEARRIVAEAERLGITLVPGIYYFRDFHGRGPCGCPAGIKALMVQPGWIDKDCITWAAAHWAIGDIPSNGLADGFDGNGIFPLGAWGDEQIAQYVFYHAVGRRVAELAGLISDAPPSNPATPLALNPNMPQSE